MMNISKIVEELFNDENLTDKHKRILEAAIFIFAKNGYSDSSTREIAIMAGVAEGTIFRHYPTKKQLLLTIMDKTLSRLNLNEIDFAESFHKDNSLKDVIRTLIRFKYSFVKRYHPIMKILIQEIAFQKKSWEPYFSLYYKAINKRFKNSLITIPNKDEMIKTEPELVIKLILSTVVGYLIMKNFLLPEVNSDEEIEIEMMANYVVNGLF